MTTALLGELESAPVHLAMVTAVIYLWAARRRSPQAAGLAVAGLGRV